MSPTTPTPEPLRGAEPGTFAHETVIRRMPAIGRRTLAEGNFNPDVAAHLEALCADLPHGRTRPLQDHSAPDWADWQSYAAPYLGQTWLDVPWFFAETYFYRCIVEITGYFSAGSGHGTDPYAHQKNQGLLQARQALQLHEKDLLLPRFEQPLDLERLLRLALWGNQADLSMWPAGGEKSGPSGGKDEHLLCDHMAWIAAHLQSQPGGRVDLVLDNTGAELAFDLLLVDGLVRNGSSCVTLWAKPHPTFVSDATPADVHQALDDLLSHGERGSRAMAERLSGHLQTGELQVESHFYWTSPLAGWEMPADLRHSLADSSLLVSKGDANYRRWLGDRQWAFDAPLEGVLDYLPAPLALLRVLKSEVAAGIPAHRMLQVASQDPEWMVNGRWGLAQFAGV